MKAPHVTTPPAPVPLRDCEREAIIELLPFVEEQAMNGDGRASLVVEWLRRQIAAAK